MVFFFFMLTTKITNNQKSAFLFFFMTFFVFFFFLHIFFVGYLTTSPVKISNSGLILSTSIYLFKCLTTPNSLYFFFHENPFFFFYKILHNMNNPLIPPRKRSKVSRACDEVCICPTLFSFNTLLLTYPLVSPKKNKM